MKPKFEIIDILSFKEEVVVIVKQKNEIKFKLQSGSKLGEIELKPIIEIPRKIDANGKQELNYFAFFLQNPKSNYKEIEKGNILELSIT